MDDPAERRWPGFADAVLDVGIRGVFALPVSLSYECVGVLRGVTATELAWEVVERRVSLDSPDWHDLGWPAGVAS